MRAMSRSGAGILSQALVKCSPIQASPYPRASARMSRSISSSKACARGFSGRCIGIMNNPYCMAISPLTSGFRAGCLTVCVLWGLSPYNMVVSYRQRRDYQTSGATLVRCSPALLATGCTRPLLLGVEDRETRERKDDGVWREDMVGYGSYTAVR